MSSETAVLTRKGESRSTQVAVTIILCPAIAAVFVALRIYTRFFLVKKRFLEDYCIVLAMVRRFLGCAPIPRASPIRPTIVKLTRQLS